MSGRHLLSWRAGLIALVLIVIGVAYFVLTKRGGPRADLSASEAVDLALFQTWTVAGVSANIAHPTEVFVADLADRDAQNFLRQNGATASLPADGLAGFVARTFIVVARGPVTAGPEADAATRAQGFVLVIDPAGAVHYVGIGSPWDVAVPPSGQKLPVPRDPSLANVSRVRARLELGGAPFVELTNPPGGLTPEAIAINPTGIPVDPSGTTYAGRSVTLIYADGTGRSRLWFSQSVAPDLPHVPGNPLPFGQKGSGVTHYAWYAGDWGIDGYAFEKAGQGFFLTAESGPDLTLETIERTVGIQAGVSPARTESSHETTLG
jgi:hypothetical protein